MRFLQIVLLLTMVMALDAAKITWDKNGKPIIEKSNKPIRGCHQARLEVLNNNDTNKTRVPCK